jgi:ribose 5-phosphate isomerase B
MSSIYLGADHAGYEYKEYVRELLEKSGIPYVDVGVFKKSPKVDYPKIAKTVAEKVVKYKGAGILICGTGTGMAMAANKVKGARAAVGYDEYDVLMARKDNDANILTFRAREFPKIRIKKLLKTFLETLPSKAERHKKRVRQVNRM